MSRTSEILTTLDIRVTGTYVPYHPATQDCQAEGGVCEDVKVYIDHPNLDDDQAGITGKLPGSMLTTLGRILADQMLERARADRHDAGI